MQLARKNRLTRMDGYTELRALGGHRHGLGKIVFDQLDPCIQWKASRLQVKPMKPDSFKRADL